MKCRNIIKTVDLFVCLSKGAPTSALTAIVHNFILCINVVNTLKIFWVSKKMEHLMQNPIRPYFDTP